MRNKDLLQKALQLVAFRRALGCDVLIDFVKGHAGISGNVHADRLAVAGAALPPRLDESEPSFEEFLHSLLPQADLETNLVLQETMDLHLEYQDDHIDHGDLLSEDELQDMEATQSFG